MNRFAILFFGLVAASVAVGCVWRWIDAPPATGGNPMPQRIAIGAAVAPFASPAVRFDGDTATDVTVDTGTGNQPTAIVFLGTACGATQRSIERLRGLESTHGPTLVDWIYVYPNTTDSAAAKRRFHRDSRLRGPMVDDRDGTIARRLGGQQTAEVLLVDVDGTLLYRGGIDDGARTAQAVKRQHLAIAIDEHRAGKKITRTTAPVRA